MSIKCKRIETYLVDIALLINHLSAAQNKFQSLGFVCPKRKHGISPSLSLTIFAINPLVSEVYS